MNTIFVALTGRRKTIGLALASVAVAGVITGWAALPRFVANAAAVERASPFEVSFKSDFAVQPSSLVGSYEVSGTDTEGYDYLSPRKVDISLAPSGALELQWDNGKSVGVAQLVGNTLAVATWVKGRTVILTMNIHSDGSLSGAWLRRTDRGAKGTEIWRRV
jgi:hypothetical protein